jgi:hypothetical protein
MAYGYNSYRFGDQAIKQSIEGVATNLLLALNEAREGCKYRPIIFIKHCFGGFVSQYVRNPVLDSFRSMF